MALYDALAHETDPEIDLELKPESWESDLEVDHETDPEAEQFFGTLAKMARSAAQSPALRSVARRAALGAAKAGLRGLGGVGSAIGGYVGGQNGSSLGRDIGSSIGRHVSSRLPDREAYWEIDPETEAEVDAMMAHLANSAAEADTEEEAFAFLAPLLPLAAKALPFAASAASGTLPKVAGALRTAAPHLGRGVQGIASSLFRNPQSRQLIRTLPTIIKKTAQNVAQQTAQGQRVTPRTAVATLARNAQRTLGSPAQCVHAYRRGRASDGRFHGRARTA